MCWFAPGSKRSVSASKLKALVCSVDPVAKEAILLPLRCAAGLCIVILFDKISTLSESAEDYGISMSPFTDSYIQQISSSGVCADILDVLQNVHCVVRSQLQLNYDIHRLEDKVGSLQHTNAFAENAVTVSTNRLENSLRFLVKCKRKVDMQKYVSYWKAYVSKRAFAEKYRKVSLMVEGLTDLIKVKQDFSGLDVTQRFLSIIELRLGALFPLDSVSATYNNADNKRLDGSTLSSIVNAARNIKGFDYSTPDSNNDIRKAILSADIVVHSNPHRASSDVITNNQSLHIGTASIIRKSTQKKSGKDFTVEETALFHQFCVIASDLYTALHNGIETEYSPGHARSLVFPMLQELLPVILQLTTAPELINANSEEMQISSHKSEVFMRDQLLPILSSWLKRITDADMVVVHLAEEGKSEIHHTSEDIRSAKAVKSNHLHDLIQSEQVTSAVGSNKITVRFSVCGDVNQDDAKCDIMVYSSSDKLAPAFTDEHKCLTEIVAYLLANTMRCNRSLLAAKESESSLQLQLNNARNRFNSLNLDFQSTDSSAASFKSRLTSMVSLQAFLDSVYSANTLEELSRLVSDVIPQIFGSSSAVLLLKSFVFNGSDANKNDSEDNITYATSNDMDQDNILHVILPSSGDENDNTSKTKTISIQKLQKIPSYFQNPSSSQSKIELNTNNNNNRNQQNRKSNNTSKLLFGSVLLFDSDSGSDNSSKGAAGSKKNRWQGLEEMLTRSLSSAIYEAATKLLRTQRMSSLVQEVTLLKHQVRNKDQLEADFESVLGIKQELEIQRDALMMDLSDTRARLTDFLNEKEKTMQALTAEITSIKANSHASEEELHHNLHLLEKEAEGLEKQLTAARISYQELNDVVTKFAFDPRNCNPDTALDWLKEMAESMQFSLVVVSQSESGELDGCSDIRGATAAVSESIRTGKTIELKSSVSKQQRNDGLRFDHASVVSSRQRSSSLKFPPATNSELEILCVPNRLLPQLALRGSIQHACFLFIRKHHPPPDVDRSGKSEGQLFSDDERNGLQCGSDLTCRVLLKSTSRFAEDDFQRLQEELEREQRSVRRLRTAVQFADKVRSTLLCPLSFVNSFSRGLQYIHHDFSLTFCCFSAHYSSCC